MEGRHVVLLLVSAVVSLSPDCVCGSELKVTVRPGDNIILYCDCKTSTGVYIMWYRNCSHEDEPSPDLKVKNILTQSLHPNFHLLKNQSSESFDLLILNITESDEGLYYCGTEEPKVEDNEHITSRYIYSYGNITTRIIFTSSDSGDSIGPLHVEPGVSWLMVFSPAITVLSTFLCLTFVYLCSQNADEKDQMTERRPDMGEESTVNQDEDACFTRVVFLVADGRNK
ncbi:uncharacterized protein LOC132995425 isoform X2 [Labrus mixtus]|uniref:uncharacterized protein LOC132995425 isoform X1 n=1 Tax=Labrus mixtus TaxID=508554 RepID=UPI0029C04B43|nr:uncharacterized protein LOC132995425 isoform X1 [Labrus mixtus]XP_060921396.1 uncharacterized protein LOC132995425 isoform X2 [Labrus mixtus]